MGFEEWDCMTSAVMRGAETAFRRRGNFTWWPFVSAPITDAYNLSYEENWLRVCQIYWGYRFGVSLPQVKEFWAGADHRIEARIERKRWNRPLAGHEVGNGSQNNYGEGPQDWHLLFDQ